VRRPTAAVAHMLEQWGLDRTIVTCGRRFRPPTNFGVIAARSPTAAVAPGQCGLARLRVPSARRFRLPTNCGVMTP
jgi:hypothetical protein